MSSEEINELLEFLQGQFDGVVAVEPGEEGVLHVDLAGACAACPMQSVTINDDMLDVVKERYPQFTRVNTRPYVSEEAMDLVKKILREGWS